MTETSPKVTTDFKSLHFAWFTGHAAIALTSTLYFTSWLLVHPSNYLYRFSYLFAVLSYSVTLYSAYKPTLQNSDIAIKRMLLDENTQYLLLAVYFFWTRRLTVSLVPFFVYSVFHVAQYIQSHLIPSLAPQASHLGDKIKIMTDQYYPLAMQYVTKYELFVVMGRLVLGLFVLRSSIFSILLYAHFLRMRYFTSSIMRVTIHDLAKQFDQYLLPPNAHPKVPAVVSKAYKTFREVAEIKKQRQQHQE